jgi:catechol 2,3-dioxygenase-like lactoylglutathione lyase family enzyme
MELLVSELLKNFEDGRVSRRTLIRTLAVLAATGSASAAAAQTQSPGSFRTVRLDHISYQVRDYRQTRDFYANLLGMSVQGDDGKRYCQLHFGEPHRQGARERSFIGVNTRAPGGQSPAAAAPGTIDHLAFTIENWETDRVKSELERRGLKPRLQAGGPGDTPNYVSFHVQDPDGFDVQIAGIAKAG